MEEIQLVLLPLKMGRFNVGTKKCERRCLFYVVLLCFVYHAYYIARLITYRVGGMVLR